MITNSDALEPGLHNHSTAMKSCIYWRDALTVTFFDLLFESGLPSDQESSRRMSMCNKRLYRHEIFYSLVGEVLRDSKSGT